jgi:hypothetical protein
MRHQETVHDESRGPSNSGRDDSGTQLTNITYKITADGMEQLRFHHSAASRSLCKILPGQSSLHVDQLCNTAQALLTARLPLGF